MGTRPPASALTIEEVSAELGVTRTVVLALIRSGELPAVRAWTQVGPGSSSAWRSMSGSVSSKRRPGATWRTTRVAARACGIKGPEDHTGEPGVLGRGDG